MKDGLSLGQVGQRPFEMGYKTMFFLKDMKDGKAGPADPTYTGLDVCTPGRPPPPASAAEPDPSGSPERERAGETPPVFVGGWPRHCEERSDEAAQRSVPEQGEQAWHASLRSQ